VPCLGREAESRAALAVGRVHRRAGLQKLAREPAQPALRRGHEQGVSVRPRDLEPRARLDEPLHDGIVAERGRQHERRLAAAAGIVGVGVLCVPLGTGRQQTLDRRDVAVGGRPDERGAPAPIAVVHLGTGLQHTRTTAVCPASAANTRAVKPDASRSSRFQGPASSAASGRALPGRGHQHGEAAAVAIGGVGARGQEATGDRLVAQPRRSIKGVWPLWVRLAVEAPSCSKPSATLA